MSVSDEASLAGDYPARLDVEYPEHGLNRVTTLFRIVLIVPIAIVVGLVSGSVASDWDSNQANVAAALTAGGLFGPTLLLILFRQKYPAGGSTGISS